MQVVPAPAPAALWEKVQGRAVTREIQVRWGLAGLGAGAARQAAAAGGAFDTYIADFFICHRAAPLPSAVTSHLEMGFPAPFPHFCSSLGLHFGLCRE